MVDETSEGTRDTSGHTEQTRNESGESELGADAVRRLCRDVDAPATAIAHLAESIASDPTASPRARHLAEMIVMQSDFVSELCASTLAIDRPAGVVRLDPIFSTCIWNTRAWFRGAIDERIDPVSIRAQRLPMLRLATNLLAIACQGAGPHGSVRIALGHDSSFAHIAVETIDAGAERGFADVLEGSDVLAWRIVSDIVAEHHGRLRIDPGPRGGTSILVDIPLSGTGDERHSR